MLWKKDVNLSVLNYSKSHIDAIMIDGTTSKKSGSLWVSMAILIQLSAVILGY